jgi:hypothetical protein
MGKFLTAVIISAMLIACGSNKNYLERSNETKALFDAVKKLNKSSNDEKASDAVPILYANLVKTHLGKINSFKAGTDLERWDRIISEYNSLQEMYNLIINSSPAFKLVTPRNFSPELQESKQQAAEGYYAEALLFLYKTGRENAKRAYGYFEKVDRLVPSYKDVLQKTELAYENAVVDVVINKVDDNRYFVNNPGGLVGYDFTNDYFQKRLVNELGADKNNRTYAARFYTDTEAKRNRVEAEWVVELRLRNISMPQPTTSVLQRERNAQVQNGTDSAGKPAYKTVYATLNINKSVYTAHADLELFIKDISGPKTVSSNSYPGDHQWQEENASYNGDSRALTNEDWELIKKGAKKPKTEDVLNELYKKMYPLVLNSIKKSAAW